MKVLWPELTTVRLQAPEPAVRLPVQLPPVELLTVTLPVGVGVPVLGALAWTVKLTVIVCPAEEVFRLLVTVVVVPACVTATPADPLLARKLISPG